MTKCAFLRKLWIIAWSCWLALPGLALAQDAAVTAAPHSVRAAYLLKLPAYVDWPTERFQRPDSALTIGVMGADEVAEALATISAARTVNGRPVVVRRVRSDDALTGVHVLFVAGASRERADRIASDAAAQSILTVTDTNPEFDDSVIDFVTVNGRVRFEVRLNAAERNGLRLHAGLLDVAARVHGARR